ncbi:ABC transporter substrate-binding protein, partial [Bacillus sp. LL01]
MKLRSFLLLVVMGLALAFLVACGPDREEEAAPAPSEGEGETEGEVTEAEKPDTLTMWVNDEDAQLDAYEEITDRFTEETGINVD